MNGSSVREVPVHENVTKELFEREIYPNREPVVLRGLDIGPCVQRWTPEYLAEKGGDKEVKIHVSSTPQMDFINKNFMYRSLPFGELVRRAARAQQEEFFIDQTEKYYLRALGDDPRKDIADISYQFPELASDLNIPDFFPPEKFFSSVFRIASPGLQLWTHYDAVTPAFMDKFLNYLARMCTTSRGCVKSKPQVMDNFLIQVQGTKRVVLFSPQSVNYLYMNGDKSEVLDIDTTDPTRYPLFAKAERFEAFLEPGDVIFIPALWFHNVISLQFGVAVNVFWKHLDPLLYDTKDTYGNKDPHPATRAMQIVDRALKTLEELPDSYRDFYARRLITRIEKKGLVNKPP